MFVTSPRPSEVWGRSGSAVGRWWRRVQGLRAPSYHGIAFQMIHGEVSHSIWRRWWKISVRHGRSGHGYLVFLGGRAQMPRRRWYFTRKWSKWWYCSDRRHGSLPHTSAGIWVGFTIRWPTGWWSNNHRVAWMGDGGNLLYLRQYRSQG